MRLISENLHPLVSARFPLLAFSSRNFAQDYHIKSILDAGFPEFTRSFNPDYSEKLQLLHEALGDNLHIPASIFLFPLLLFSTLLYIPLQRCQNLFGWSQDDEIQVLLCILHTRIVRTCRLCVRLPSGESLFCVFALQQEDILAVQHMFWYPFSYTVYSRMLHH